MKFLARLEADRLARGYVDLGTGARVASNASLAWANVEDPETAQLDAIARSKRFFQTFKDGVDSRFRLVARQSGPGDHLMNDVLFNQSLYPEG